MASTTNWRTVVIVTNFQTSSVLCPRLAISLRANCSYPNICGQGLTLFSPLQYTLLNVSTLRKLLTQGMYPRSPDSTSLRHVLCPAPRQVASVGTGGCPDVAWYSLLKLGGHSSTSSVKTLLEAASQTLTKGSETGLEADVIPPEHHMNVPEEQGLVQSIPAPKEHIFSLRVWARQSKAFWKNIQLLVNYAISFSGEVFWKLRELYLVNSIKYVSAT